MIIDRAGRRASAQPAGRSATPRRIACSRSPRMRSSFGLDRLIALCKALAPILHAMRVGRVIARPFIGSPGRLHPHAHRRDFAIAPPAPTLLDKVAGGRPRHPCDRQDRRHLLDARHRRSAQGHRCRTDGALADARRRGRAGIADLRQFRRVRQRLWPPPRRLGLCPRAGMVRRRTAAHLSAVSAATT